MADYIRCPQCNAKNYNTAASCEKCGFGFNPAAVQANREAVHRSGSWLVAIGVILLAVGLVASLSGNALYYGAIAWGAIMLIVGFFRSRRSF